MEVAMKYYAIGFPQDSPYGVGVTSDGERFSFLDVPDSGRITHWEPILLNLKEGGFSDYQGSNPVCRLCSEKLKSIIENCKSAQDEIQWLPMLVRDEQGEEREYFILHFPEEPDVIDWKNSITVDRRVVVKPVFSLRKIGEHKVFNYPSGAFLGFIISEDVKKEIEKANCNGFVVSKVPLVD